MAFDSRATRRGLRIETRAWNSPENYTAPAAGAGCGGDSKGWRRAQGFSIQKNLQRILVRK
jgi:hypothetical protein